MISESHSARSSGWCLEKAQQSFSCPGKQQSLTLPRTLGFTVWCMRSCLAHTYTSHCDGHHLSMYSIIIIIILVPHLQSGKLLPSHSLLVQPIPALWQWQKGYKEYSYIRMGNIHFNFTWKMVVYLQRISKQ